ncbi:MAG TPA: methyltransferase [Acidobacteriaceae bacterium]|jgi:protein-S-isoprenylcysteine O-methyltransferase Ste14
MHNVSVIRFASLYLPLTAATLAACLLPRRQRMFAACLLSLLWTLPALLILQRINLIENWWTFEPQRPALLGMPLELYLGWAMLWGLIPQLTFRRLDFPEVIVIMGALDLWIMPLNSQVLPLNDWWVGEVAALALVLAPAFCVARWTLDNSHLKLRATLQVLISGLLFLFFLPEVAFALRPAAGASSVWEPLIHTPGLLRQTAIQLILLLAVPGVSAVAEFVQRGLGTPIPYDPPQRIVTSGIYRYCANPMQLFCAVVMSLWALLLRNPWLVLAAAMSTLYSAGIAHWDEDRDLAARFGEPWKHYRIAVPSWRLRWRPYHAGLPARLYIARTCGPCSEIRQWIEHRHPIGLELIDAETLPKDSIRRLRYDPADGTPAVEGLVAFARALEHLNLAWAYCGITLRLPIVHQTLQLLMDASGLGPRKVPSTCAR